MKEGRQVRSAGPTCGPAPGVRLQEQLIHVPRAEGLWGSKTQTCHLMVGDPGTERLGPVTVS